MKISKSNAITDQGSYWTFTLGVLAKIIGSLMPDRDENNSQVNALVYQGLTVHTPTHANPIAQLTESRMLHLQIIRGITRKKIGILE